MRNRVLWVVVPPPPKYFSSSTTVWQHLHFLFFTLKTFSFPLILMNTRKMRPDWAMISEKTAFLHSYYIPQQTWNQIQHWALQTTDFSRLNQSVPLMIISIPILGPLSTNAEQFTFQKTCKSWTLSRIHNATSSASDQRGAWHDVDNTFNFQNDCIC